ncbi:hypothetical protein NQ314_016974 [Rhamnusium bicolor]|uniref:C2H2-type domain-containing protein n=1 Tax=Rhamnusium bicolor TaxID=1586634 RepID=A0AAV8WVH3_9CUCU|nr:hypothetical protein NQ314_016974 [Rhamnusium bicolor]
MYAPMFCHSIFSETEIKTEPFSFSSSNDEISHVSEKDSVTDENLLIDDRVDDKKSKQQTCKICGKVLSSASSYYVHLKQHSDNKPYRFKSYLVAHQWSHAAIGGILCNLCQMSFTNKSQFLQHMRSHSDKGFKCKDCQKSFAKESYLIRHKNRVHKNDVIADEKLE